MERGPGTRIPGPIGYPRAFTLPKSRQYRLYKSSPAYLSIGASISAKLVSSGSCMSSAPLGVVKDISAARKQAEKPSDGDYDFLPFYDKQVLKRLHPGQRFATRLLRERHDERLLLLCQPIHPEHGPCEPVIVILDTWAAICRERDNAEQLCGNGLGQYGAVLLACGHDGIGPHRGDITPGKNPRNK